MRDWKRSSEGMVLRRRRPGCFGAGSWMGRRSEHPRPSSHLPARRESFEHEVLPMPTLVFPEGTLTQTLAQLVGRFAVSSGERMDTAG
jgi:hypothetical protein